jgi:branched-chain amino acid transport system substrate-binding protein
MIGDFTGPGKAIGRVHKAGLMAAADYVNAKGGIEGHQVKVRTVDDAGDPKNSVALLLKELDKGTPTLIDAGSESGTQTALMPALAREKAFAINVADVQGICAKDPKTTCPYTFSIGGATGLVNAQPQAVDFFKSKNATNVGVMEEGITFAQAETPLFEKAAKDGGLKTTVATFPATAVDVTPQMQKLKDAGAQAVYFEGIGPAAGYALKARAKLGWDVPILFDLAASAVDITKLVQGADTSNTYQIGFYEQDPSETSEGIKALIKGADKYGGIGSDPLENAAAGWDPIMLLNSVGQLTGGDFSPDALRDAMYKVPLKDPLRVFARETSFSPENHDNNSSSPDDYVVLPVGPLVNGQISAP